LVSIVLYNQPDIALFEDGVTSEEGYHVTIGNCLTRSWALSALLFGALSAHSAYASLVFTGVATGSGAGIGTSNVVMTIQNSGTEQGCVGWSGTVNVVGSTACSVVEAATVAQYSTGLSPAITGGNEKTGSSQTQTRTVTQAGVLTGQSLAVILNVSEPGGTLFTVENLSLTVYSPTGTVLFTSGNLFGAGVPPGGGITINSSFQGQGNLGFAFLLDFNQVVAINPFICTNALLPGCGSLSAAQLAANAGNRLGLASILTNTQGGNETFSIADTGNLAIVTPEPVTLLTMAGGLILFAVSRRFRGGRHKGQN
jgi:hypothetical protein